MSIRTVNLTVDVHFEKPTTLPHHDIIYRIYINEELLIERSWIWDYQTFLKENICINADSDTIYTIFLDTILSIPRNSIKFSGLTFQNLQITNGEINIVDCNPQSITFKIL